MNQVFVITGVSGSGKTTVGIALAERLDVPFYDGDDFHPAENVAKMANGQPLNDDDRYPWLARLHDLIANHLAKGQSAVVACSALKNKYRDQLRQGNQGMRIIYLQGSFELILGRMKARKDHFMKADMLQSQFDTLESPSAHNTLIVSIDGEVDEIIAEITNRIAAPPDESDG